MANPQKAKGDRAEREAAELITRLVGVPIVRKLGAGRFYDEGDMEGLPDHTIQVAHWTDVVAALRIKPLDVDIQAANAGTRFRAAFIRLPRSGFRVAMTPEAWAELVIAGRGHGLRL